MANNYINNHILIRKRLLNFLLKYLSPTNKFIIFLSQNLDKLVCRRQDLLYLKHRQKQSHFSSLTEFCEIKKLNKFA